MAKISVMASVCDENPGSPIAESFWLFDLSTKMKMNTKTRKMVRGEGKGEKNKEESKQTCKKLKKKKKSRKSKKL